VNALANNEVGKYLNTYFVASYQKVGTFRIVDSKKQGGNVAAYFCSPGGQVLHALAGPVSAALMLREARWVIETHKLAILEGQDAPDRLKAFFGKAHADRLWQEYGMRVDDPGQPPTGLLAQVHLLLATAPNTSLGRIYRYVFENILQEKLSTNPVEIVPGP
jgi:hypothetical protein